MDYTDEIEVPDGYKLCCDCNEVKHKDEYYTSKYGKMYKCCKVCYANKFTVRLRENGGSTRVKHHPDSYSDSMQQAQTFEFMKLCGWTYTKGVDDAPGIWWKKGIKSKLNVWDKVPTTKKKVRPKPTRIALATKFDKLYKVANEIAFKRSKGMSFEDIADIYDCSHTTIRTVFRKYEDERRRN